MKTQEELFNDIQHLKYKLDHLSAVFQNDFDQCIDDKIYDKEMLGEMLDRFINMSAEFSEEFFVVKNNGIFLLRNKIKELNKHR